MQTGSWWCARIGFFGSVAKGMKPKGWSRVRGLQSSGAVHQIEKRDTENMF